MARTFLPPNGAHQQISDEQGDAQGFAVSTQTNGANRVITWNGDNVRDGASIHYSLAASMRAMRFDLPTTLDVPASYPESIAAYLRPEEAIQVDAPEIAAALAKIRGDQGSVLERLRRIYALTSKLKPRSFKGTTDALTALRLGEASCNGKSRLFVALARAAGLPARLVGGLVLEAGTKRTSHQWVEVYVAGHWVPFCPTNHHFASLPASYLTLYRGDQALFRHTSDINFDYHFSTATSLVPSPRAKESFRVSNVWALFERLGLPFTLLLTILMLPLGALIGVVFRNVICLPTFGTFLPALLAAASSETGAFWGVVAVLIIVAVVVAVRRSLHRLELLHSPTLAILLAAVALTMLGTALASDQLGLVHLTRITMFPMAVMAITAERFFLA